MALVQIPTNPNVMRFEITLNKKCGSETLKIQVERHKSGAYKYGNGTAVEVYVNDRAFQLFDTRYVKEIETIEGFQKYFTDWVFNSWKENADKIERIL